MGKISPVSSKYIIHARIRIEGVVDKPDVIGSVFGQTEGLLGNDLELRELQRTGRIGRIEVDIETRNGKTEGVISVPTSTDKTETVLIGAALETIERIGPCNAHVSVEKIEDIRISKRSLVIERAKQLLNNLTHSVLPDTREIKDQVNEGLSVFEITAYGREALPAGSAIDTSEEIIVVEGRADVLNLMKYGIKNVIALNGTSVPQTIIDLSKKKTVTAFVDGDRGGDLIIRELGMVGEIDFVAKAPDGKEVEEITSKEIYKALRSRITYEQAKLDFPRSSSAPERQERRPERQRPRIEPRPQETLKRRTYRQPNVREEDSKNFKKMLDDLVGTRGAYILDENSNILGKVPTSELQSTLGTLSSGIHAIVMDGNLTSDLLSVAERASVKYVIARDADVNSNRLCVMTSTDLA